MSLLLLTGLLSARHSFVYLLLGGRREAAEQVSKKDPYRILSNFCNSYTTFLALQYLLYRNYLYFMIFLEGAQYGC